MLRSDQFTVENDGTVIQATSYYNTAQAQRGEFYLTWNAGCARLLVPSFQRHFLHYMRCKRVIITKKMEGIHIMFDDESDRPFVIVIAHEQNDRLITPGECEFAVYIKLGEKFRLPCLCVLDN